MSLGGWTSVDPFPVRENLAAWEAMAESFDRTRRRPWAPVVEFLARLPRGARVLDAGAGNGRHVVPAAERDHQVFALDLSRRLLRLARRRVPPGCSVAWVQGALEALPLRPRTFDAVLALATLHHLRPREIRRQTLAGLAACLRPNGQLLLSVWSRNQSRFEDPAKPLRPAGAPSSEPGDFLLEWRQDQLRVDRFVHLYERGELEADLEGVAPGRFRVWPERLASRGEPDNLFALVEAGTRNV